MARAHTLFVCSECGNETAKWFGQCPACKKWNTLEEMEALPAAPAKRGLSDSLRRTEAQPLSAVPSADELRTSSGMEELDRVLGGGTVLGSLILVGGEPGIGKSTLLLQVGATLAGQGKVLYVSGEESPRQIKLRAQRLGIASDTLYIHAETRMDGIMDTVNRLQRWPVRRSWSIWWTACCISRATGTPATASSGRSRTVTALPTRSACSR